VQPTEAGQGQRTAMMDGDVRTLHTDNPSPPQFSSPRESLSMAGPPIPVQKVRSSLSKTRYQSTSAICTKIAEEPFFNPERQSENPINPRLAPQLPQPTKAILL
jgi:hypothetical protein